MTQSLFTSITGMTTSQTKLDVIANNIANMNTTAFKSSNLTFSDLYSKTLSAGSAPTSTVGGTNPIQVGLGVGLAGISTDFTAGSNQSTGNADNLYLSGKGWFTVQTSDGNIGLTRDGSFSLDADGNLVTSNGLKVLGTETVSDLKASNVPVKIPSNLDISVIGKDLTVGDADKLENLNNVNIKKGGTFNIGIKDTDGNIISTLEIDMSDDDTESLSGIATLINNKIKTDARLYDDTTNEYAVKAQVNNDGTFSLVIQDIGKTPAVGSLAFEDIEGNFCNETRLDKAMLKDDAYTSNQLSQQIIIDSTTKMTDNTAKRGDYSISKTGTITANYTSGNDENKQNYEITVETKGNNILLKCNNISSKDDIIVKNDSLKPANLQLQLASVVNEQGLQAQQGNLYTTGANSGDMTFSIGNANGFSEIGSGGLESSNVNLAIELANMIIAQRAIDANSRVFSSTSEVLQRLVNLQ